MKSDKKTTTNKLSVKMSAIDQYEVNNIVSPIEKELNGRDWIVYGEGNDYPNYLYSLYTDVSTLQAIVNGIADYAGGDEVISNVAGIEDGEEFVRRCAMDYALFGGFYLNVLRNRLHNVAQVVNVDYRKVRSDKNNEKFYYSEDFLLNKSYGRMKTFVLNAFDAEKTDDLNSIFYFKSNSLSTYSLPYWSGAVLAAECERSNNRYQLNSIKNGFQGSYVINFNNGVPTDEEKEEIEAAIFDKFCSENNAGMPLISYSDDKAHSVTISKIEDNQFADRYAAMAKRSKQELFTAFRAAPQLFGIPTEGNGFSDEDYKQAFKLFNRTVIKPIQKAIVNSVNKIYGMDNALIIKPFTIDFSDEGDSDEGDSNEGNNDKTIGFNKE